MSTSYVESVNVLRHGQKKLEVAGGINVVNQQTQNRASLVIHVGTVSTKEDRRVRRRCSVVGFEGAGTGHKPRSTHGAT